MSRCGVRLDGPGKGGFPVWTGPVALGRLRPVLAKELRLGPRRQDDGVAEAATERIDLFDGAVADVDGRPVQKARG